MCKSHRAAWYRPGGFRYSPGCWSLYYVRRYGPEVGPYCPRVRRDIDHEPHSHLKSASEVGVPTPYGAVSARGMSTFVPGLLELSIYESISGSEMGDGALSPGEAGPQRCPEGELSPRAGSMKSPSQTSIISLWGWDFHTLRRGIDPRDVRFRLRALGVVYDVWKDLRSGDGILSSPCSAGRRCPVG